MIQSNTYWNEDGAGELSWLLKEIGGVSAVCSEETRKETEAA